MLSYRSMIRMYTQKGFPNIALKLFGEMLCGDKEGARRVFDAMQVLTVVTWNTMISGYCKNDSPKEALMIYRRMEDADVDADCATVLSLLPARGFHSLVEKAGFWDNLSVRNAVIDMYAKCGRMDEAKLVFEEMIDRDVVTWTAMIDGFISGGDIKNALWFSRRMQLDGVTPNAVTLASFLAACASLPHLRLGKCLHGWAIRQDLQADVNIETGLIDMYAKCNCFRLGYQVFAKTTKQRTVPWNAILSGCLHNELAREAIEPFKHMLSGAVKPNDATLKNILPAFSIEADLRQLYTAIFLVNIYSKCGNLVNDHKIFNGIPKKQKDIILWSTLIAGYGMHGHGETCLSLFSEMVQSSIKQNEVTFTSVLHACGHAGLVDDGLCLFNFMLRNHCDSLRTDHYTCMVDLLDRAAPLEEAYELIKTMTFEPSQAIWGALLGACVIHENAELGELAAGWLFKLGPENTGNYVLLGKIYSAVGRWTENVRPLMNEVGVVEAPAQSVIG
ncbi:unnamed protein product [Withania somnifera]